MEDRTMTAEHENKVRECLALLGQAQSIINLAASALSCVPGFAREWGELTEPHDCIKKHWHKVYNRRSALKGRDCEEGGEK